MNEMRDLFIELATHYYGWILFFIAISSYLHWRRLIDAGPQTMSFMRRMSLYVFLVAFFLPYMKLAAYIKNRILSYDTNYVFSQILHQYKGTDWLDGILDAFFFFLYIIMFILMRQREKKAAKKPEGDKPFKIEARIGNIENKK